MWQIRIHNLVLKEDFKSISPSDQSVLIKTINKKLSQAPESYGRALRKGYHPYWKLRVGDYRVIYRLERTQIVVFVIKIEARKDVYTALAKRLRQIA